MKILLRRKAFALNAPDYPRTNQVDNKEGQEFEVELYKEVDAPDNLWDILEQMPVALENGLELRACNASITKNGLWSFDVTPACHFSLLQNKDGVMVESAKAEAEKTFEEWNKERLEQRNLFRKNTLGERFFLWMERTFEFEKKRLLLDYERAYTYAKARYQKILSGLEEAKKETMTAEELLSTGWKSVLVEEWPPRTRP